jgi:predicted RNA methylase
VASRDATFTVHSGRQIMQKKEREKANELALKILKNNTNDEILSDPSRIEAIAGYTGKGGTKEVDLNQYYTANEIIPLVFQALPQLGYVKGVALEPSCGTGRFLDKAPDRYLVHGIEIDPIASRISQILYPRHIVEQADFRRFAIAQEQKSEPLQYDMVFGNPPFGTFTLNEEDLEATAYGRDRSSNKMEVFFVEKCSEYLKKGGIMAMVLPYSCLSGEHLTSWRDRLSKMGMHLLGALRFPERTHDGTGVVSDLWFLAKSQYKGGGSSFVKGTWMEEHPQFILGEPGTRSRYGKDEYTVKGTPNWEAIGNEVLPNLIEMMRKEMKSYEIRPSNHKQGTVQITPDVWAEFEDGAWNIHKIPLQAEEELAVSIRELLNMSFEELLGYRDGLQAPA